VLNLGIRLACPKKNVVGMQSELQSVLSHEDLMGSCVLIFANKQDLKDALTVEELTQKLSLHSIKTHDWHIQSCCAVDGEPALASFQPASKSCRHAHLAMHISAFGMSRAQLEKKTAVQ
jgi:hypothetical protein